MLNDFKTPKSRCPHCGYKVDRTTQTKAGETPEPGCISLCLECAAITIFDEQMKLRKMTTAEMLELQRSSAWPHLERVRAVLVQTQKGSLQ